MGQNPSPEWIISEDDLKALTDRFREFEGAFDPRSLKCREAESAFNCLIEQLYREKVAPKFPSITPAEFRSRTRYQCRLRMAKEAPPFPCLPS
jgi:hypothetical protein